ncbi:hypothetical protein BDZ94DRAFT_1315525 [Collybia nuda]|uniref:Uncharacterized protein n=1 Tax=Collybia nuda TaxID=64659 RepID=A0A9P5XT57_9AGAR|nr:hypothetical protein BDZ94DRAFT_1315525 [Collybia nuda]
MQTFSSLPQIGTNDDLLTQGNYIFSDVHTFSPGFENSYKMFIFYEKRNVYWNNRSINYYNLSIRRSIKYYKISITQSIKYVRNTLKTASLIYLKINSSSNRSLAQSIFPSLSHFSFTIVDRPSASRTSDPTTTTTKAINAEQKHTSSTRGAMIGGIIGGLTSCVLIITGLLSYCFKKRKHGALAGKTSPGTGFANEVTRQLRYSLTVHPMIQSEEHPQPEGKRGSSTKSLAKKCQITGCTEWIGRVRREMAEAERQRSIFLFSLEQHENNMGELFHGPDSEVDELRHQIAELTRRMEEFEMIRRDDLEISAPPDYYSRSAPSIGP